MDQHFVIVTTVYNSVEYIGRCLDSLRSQTYTNYTPVIVDDGSTDGTADVVRNCNLPNAAIQVNPANIGSGLANIVTAIGLGSKDREDVIVTLDGDDRLYTPSALAYLNGVYQDPSVWLTYGQFVPASGAYGKFCFQIPDHRSYRKSDLWCASHLRSFKRKLWNRVRDEDLRDTDGQYFRLAYDNPMLYPMLEMAGPQHARFIDEILYEYNDLNPMNEMKIAAQRQTEIHNYVRSKPEYPQIDGEL